MTTLRAPERTIRKRTLKKTPSLSPNTTITNLHKLIQSKQNISWIWRVFGAQPDPGAIAPLWVDIAKNQIKLQLQEAGKSYVTAASHFQQADQPNQVLACRRQAIQQFTRRVHAPRAEELDTVQCHILLTRAIGQLQLMQAHYEGEAKWDAACKVVEEKAQHYLNMEKYKEASEEYFYAALRLCGERTDRINRCLIFCTACRILMSAEALARVSWRRALKNLESSSGTTQSWTKDSCFVYVLCTLYLTDLSQQDNEWKTALTQAKHSNPSQVKLFEDIEVRTRGTNYCTWLIWIDTRWLWRRKIMRLFVVLVPRQPVH